MVLFCCVATAGSNDNPPPVTYRVSASEVRVTFFTTDENNRAVQEVQKEDFAIVDGETVVRNFRSLTRSAEASLDLVILVDTSSSVAAHLQPAVEQILQLTAQNGLVNRDHVSVVAFSDLQASLLCSGDCSSAQAIGNLRTLRAGGPTPLYDALAFAADFLSHRATPGVRPVLLLFSDGDDTISKISLRDALQAVVATGALVYTVDLNVLHSENSRRRNAGQSGRNTALQELAFATGGRYFATSRDAANALQSALDDLRASYVVTYDPPDRAEGFHPLRILPKHNRNLQFHCRSGYYYAATAP